MTADVCLERVVPPALAPEALSTISPWIGGEDVADTTLRKFSPDVAGIMAFAQHHVEFERVYLTALPMLEQIEAMRTRRLEIDARLTRDNKLQFKRTELCTVVAGLESGYEYRFQARLGIPRCSLC